MSDYYGIMKFLGQHTVGSFSTLNGVNYSKDFANLSNVNERVGKKKHNNFKQVKHLVWNKKILNPKFSIFHVIQLNSPFEIVYSQK